MGAYKKVKGETLKDKTIVLYNNDGTNMDKSIQPVAIDNFWNTVYRSRENRIDVWNVETRHQYESTLEEANRKHCPSLQVRRDRNGQWEEINAPSNPRENMDMAFRCEETCIKPMTRLDINSSVEVRHQLKKTKSKRAQDQMS